MRSLFCIGISLFFGVSLLSRAADADISGTFHAPVQSTTSVAAAWIDLPGVLKSASPNLTKFSVNVRSADHSDADHLRAQLCQVDNGFYQILLEVPKASDKYPIGSTREFHFSIGPNAGDSPEAPLKTNLIEDGDFSQPIPTNHNFQGIEVVSLPEGGNALAFHADEKGEGPIYTAPIFAVTGGEHYEVSFHYKIENAAAHPRYNLTFYSWFNFLDADGNQLYLEQEGRAADRKMVVATKDTDSGGWQQVNVVIAAPMNAARALLDLRNGSTEPFSVMVKDIRIVPTSYPNAEIKAPGSAAILPQANPVADVSRRFDFGPPGGMLQRGFTLVSPQDNYKAERGWGFSKLVKPEAFDGGRPDALGRDCITAENAEFQVDLENGEYLVWFLIGDAGGANSVVQFFFFDQFLEANKQVIHQFDPVPSKYIPEKHLAHYSDFWLPGMDYYDTFIRPKFEEKAARIHVTDGKLRIRWRNLPMAAAMIRPATNEAAFQADIERLSRERRRDTRITEVAPRLNTAPIQPTPEENKRGFVLFRKPTNENIYPKDIPAANERISTLETFATSGQSESVWFSLHALKDTKPISIKVSDLKNGENIINASHLDIRIARYIFRDANSRGINPDYRYQISALPLDKRAEVPLVQGHNWTWCVDLQVPEGTPAGVYSGSVSVLAADGHEMASLPLRLRLLPFSLEPLPILLGYFYFPSEPWYAAFWGKNVYGKRIKDDPAVLDLIKQNERREFAFMKSLGLNSVTFSDDLRGDLVYHDGEVNLKPNDRFSFWMDLYKEAGFSTMPWYGFYPIGAVTGRSNPLTWLDDSLKPAHTDHWHKAYRSLAKNISKHAKEQGWPEILFYISDELSNEGQQGAELGVALGKSLRQVDGIRTIASMNGPSERIMVPYVDIAMPNFAFPLSDDIFKFMHKSDTELWLYNCGGERITMGLWTWRMGVKGRYQWHYRSLAADPWDDAGGGALSKYVVSYPGPDGPIPTVCSDTVRAAITDYRYMATLEKMVKQRQGDARYARQVQSARRFIEHLRERLPIDPRLFMKEVVDAKEAGGVLHGEFANPDAITRIRWAIAQLILDLQ